MSKDLDRQGGGLLELMGNTRKALERQMAASAAGSGSASGIDLHERDLGACLLEVAQSFRVGLEFGLGRLLTIHGQEQALDDNRPLTTQGKDV